MNVLYEILVPTIFGDTMKPIRKAHHYQWDKYVQSLTGGLTIMHPGKGKWLHKGVEYPERVIPVRVMVEETIREPLTIYTPRRQDKSQIREIIRFTLNHYRQKAVMCYIVSNDANIYTLDDYRLNQRWQDL